jgi:hypothetical protein
MHSTSMRALGVVLNESIASHADESARSAYTAGIARVFAKLGAVDLVTVQTVGRTIELRMYAYDPPSLIRMTVPGVDGGVACAIAHIYGVVVEVAYTDRVTIWRKHEYLKLLPYFGDQTVCTYGLDANAPKFKSRKSRRKWRIDHATRIRFFATALNDAADAADAAEAVEETEETEEVEYPMRIRPIVRWLRLVCGLLLLTVALPPVCVGLLVVHAWRSVSSWLHLQ